MEKREFKMYEAPTMEVVEMSLQGILCVSTNADNADMESGGEGGW